MFNLYSNFQMYLYYNIINVVHNLKHKEWKIIFLVKKNLKKELMKIISHRLQKRNALLLIRNTTVRFVLCK